MGLMFNPIEVMSPATVEAIKNRKNTSFYHGPCDSCRVGDHGRCWRSVCHCKHEGWVRDINAQMPHGLAAGFSKDVKFYQPKPRKGKLRKSRAKRHKRKEQAHYVWNTEAMAGG